MKEKIIAAMICVELIVAVAVQAPLTDSDQRIALDAGGTVSQAMYAQAE